MGRARRVVRRKPPAEGIAEDRSLITDVHHVGIAVRDLDAALVFYRDTLSLPLVKEGEVPARGVRAAMLSAGRGYLELVQPVAEDSPFAEHVERSGGGLHHLALWSSDVDGDVARLREAGVPLVDNQPREGFTGRLSYLAPDAFDGALIEVIEPEPLLAGAAGGDQASGAVTRIDHVVLRVPVVSTVSERFRDWFGVETKRTFQRGRQDFAFMRPGDTIIEVIGPTEGGSPGTGIVAGLAFEVTGIDELTARVKEQGFPIGEPHPALQGGRIVSVHPSGACGVPVAFIDFADSPGPPRR